MTTSTAASVPVSIDFLSGGGELGARMRAHDWRATSLGPPEHWPRSLKTAVRIMLTSRQPMWIGWGRDLAFLYNDAYKSIIGARHPWALGKPTSEVWHEIWLDIAPRLERALVGNEGTYDERLLLMMERNGYPEETYYTFSYSPIPDDDGLPRGIFCANTDDTARIIHERQLALLGALAGCGGLASSVGDACVRCCDALRGDRQDLPFALIYVVRPTEARAMLGCSAGIDGGHPLAPLTLDLDAHAPWPVGEVLATGEWRIADLPRSVTVPGGAWPRAPAQAATIPLVTGGGDVERAVLVAALSPYRLLDERYREFLSLVATQIGTTLSTAKAHADERRRAEALAELDRAKTVFFSNVSHEFRTPLTLMLGPLETLLAQSGALDGRERETVDLALRNGRRLSRLVDALLDFSRLEAGRVQATFEPTDLSAFTRDIAVVFREAMEDAGLAFEVDCSALPDAVYVDREMWEKIVLNLVSNAFKYTLHGKVRVSLAAEGSSAVLRVADTGVGIPASALPHVFERFYRVEGAPARTCEGTGIGLALVHELGALHHASVDVESEVGRGTTFTVRIPFGTRHLPAQRIRPSNRSRAPGSAASSMAEEAMRWADGTTPGSAGQPPRGSRGSVLIVEDNADMRGYLANLLAPAHEVRTARDGQEALDAVRERAPDLVLTDTVMPRVDGTSLTRRLREDVATADIPVIALSARVGEDARLEGLSAGADEYVNKPFTARELLARVDAALMLARTRGRARAALADEAHFLETLNHVGRTVAGDLDLKRVTQTVCKAATALTGAAAGALVCNLQEPGGTGGWSIATAGPLHQALERLPLPPQSPLLDETLQRRLVVRRAELPADVGSGLAPVAPDEPRMQSYLAVPVVSRSGEVAGALVFVHPDPGHFDERSERLAAGIALQGAAAIDNARLYQAAQREIAERARVEAALRASEERFRLATRTGKVGIWDWDIARNALVWSESLYAIHGVTPDAVEGTLEGFERLVHPDDRERVRQAIGATLERDVRYEVEFRTVRSDGEELWLHSEAGLVRDEAGRPARLLGATMDITARKRAELAMRESEERFRTMADNAPVMIWVTDPDGACIFLSRSWYEFTGMTPEQALGDGWGASLHPDDRERLSANFRAHNGRREPYEVEHRVRRADGGFRWCLSRAAPRFAPDGRYLGYIGSMIDITERKRAESALRASEARYRQLVQGLPAAVHVCDATGHIVLFNDESVALWGRTPVLGEEMGGTGFPMFDLDGSPLPGDRRPLSRALHGETVAGTEAIIQRPGGERRNVIVYPQVIRDDAGTIIGAVKVMIDITERKSAEAELAATKDDLAVQVAALTRLHDLATKLAGMQELEPALDAVLETLVAITGSEFGVLSLHEPDMRRLRAVASHGFTPELLARVECVTPGMGACGQTLLTKSRTVVEDVRQDPLFATMQPFAEDAGFRAVHSTPILNHHGDVLGVLSVHFQAPHVPSALEVQFADMCARYAAETIELIRSQQSLREADRRKDEFLATLAHELRNPLAPIRNAMHVIKMAGDDRNAIAETRGIIERQLQQMVRLVDDLLDVSRISRGKIELRREDVDLADVLRSAIETSDALIKQHGHTLELELAPEPVMLSADQTRLAQVFSNLLNNAAKYTPPGGTIRLSVRRKGGDVEVSVKDNGIGIPPAMLPSVFDMFTQVESSLERSGGGLGVGLTIVKRLVEMHGGTIEAHSQGKGKGSEFVVTFPVQRSAAGSSAPAAPPADKVADIAVARRILVVDDNVDLATTLTRMLTMMGNEVHTVHDGAAALEATDHFRPDVIFLDIGMPKMNGYEAARRIRERRAGRDAVIVALSGWGQEHDKQRSLEAGMDLHLVKPIDPAALDSLLASLPVRSPGHASASHIRDGDAAEAAEPSERAERGPVVSLAERLRSTDDKAPIDATRFALFRRLAPALRHDLVGELQGIRFAVDLAQRQLRQWTDEPAMGESLTRVASQTQEALKSGDAILDWLRPDAAKTATVCATIEECLAMVRTDWSMRGIEVQLSLPAAERNVQGQGFREVFAASLLALSDALRTPADVEVVAADDGPMVELRMSARIAAREAFPPTPVARPFGWDEAQALARANNVEWSRQDLKVSMRFPGATALAA